MNFRTKMENAKVRPEDVLKYHVEVSREFDEAEINKVKAYLRFATKKVIMTQHHANRQIRKRIPNIPFWKFMKMGKCFEYKMVDGSLYRLAIRLEGNAGEDYISVFQPQYNNDNELEVVVITCYANKKDDQHFTLRSNEYVS